MDRPRVTFLITELDPGGAERALVRIATGLSDEHWDRTVICLGDRGELVEPLEAVGIPVTCLGARQVLSPGGLWRSTCGLTRELRRQQPAVLQTFLWHANIAGRLAARRAGIPHVVSGIRVAEKRGRWRLRLDRWTEHLVQRHVCVSQAVADFSTETSGLNAGKILVIPNGVDLEKFRDVPPADLTSFGIPPGAKTLLTVGRLDPQKDPLTLVAAVGLLSENQIGAERNNQPLPAHLLIVGQGPMEAEIAQAAKRHGIADRVHLAGWQSDVAGLMRAADVFVLASRWEGMPNALLEAAAAGLPIVATRAEGVSEVIRNDQVGTLVEIGNEAELAGAISETLHNKDAARQGAARLQDVIANVFTWESVVSRYEELYRSLIAGADRS